MINPNVTATGAMSPAFLEANGVPTQPGESNGATTPSPEDTEPSAAASDAREGARDASRNDEGTGTRHEGTRSADRLAREATAKVLEREINASGSTDAIRDVVADGQVDEDEVAALDLDDEVELLHEDGTPLTHENGETFRRSNADRVAAGTEIVLEELAEEFDIDRPEDVEELERLVAAVNDSERERDQLSARQESLERALDRARELDSSSERVGHIEREQAEIAERLLEIQAEREALARMQHAGEQQRAALDLHATAQDARAAAREEAARAAEASIREAIAEHNEDARSQHRGSARGAHPEHITPSMVNELLAMEPVEFRRWVEETFDDTNTAGLLLDTLTEAHGERHALRIEATGARAAAAAARQREGEIDRTMHDDRGWWDLRNNDRSRALGRVADEYEALASGRSGAANLGPATVTDAVLDAYLAAHGFAVEDVDAGLDADAALSGTDDAADEAATAAPQPAPTLDDPAAFRPSAEEAAELAAGMTPDRAVEHLDRIAHERHAAFHASTPAASEVAAVNPDLYASLPEEDRALLADAEALRRAGLEYDDSGSIRAVAPEPASSVDDDAEPWLDDADHVGHDQVDVAAERAAVIAASGGPDGVAATADTAVIVIQPGQNLSLIAHQLNQAHGTSVTWQDIHALNRDQISDPNLIYPQQVFVLPDAVLLAIDEQARQEREERERAAAS